MTPLKARLVDAIRRSGPTGISGSDLIDELNLPINRKTLAAHIWQVNSALASTDFQIRGRGGYRLVRLTKGAPR
jgi:hypothetical protein